MGNHSRQALGIPAQLLRRTGLGQLDLPGASEEIVDQAATQTMACTEDETQAEAADCISQESAEYPSSCPVAGLAVR